MDGCLPIPSAWMYKSPDELLPGNDELIFTTGMDVYSFACVVFSVRKSMLICSPNISLIYQMYTLDDPLPRPIEFPGDIRCIYEIAKKGHGHALRNLRPTSMTTNLWGFLHRCWSVHPSGRPHMTEVVTSLSVL